MSIISRITTWADGQTLFSADLNGEFNNIVNLFNNLDSASSTWSNVKISSTATNPMQVISSGSTSELSVDCTGSNGNPIHTFKRSGTTYFTIGVNASNSNSFTWGTTSLTTNVAFLVPTAGQQVQFQPGSLSAPGISTIGDVTTGILANLSGKWSWVSTGSNTGEFSSQGFGLPNGSTTSPSLYFQNSATTGISRGGSNILTINTNGASGAYIQLQANGDIITTQLAPLATSATAGFFFLPTVAGTPTGAPSTYTGNAACLIDTTGTKLWVHFSGGWKSVALS